MSYLVIYSEDGGKFWRQWGGAHAESTDALVELHTGARANPDCTFEMHPVSDRLLQALRWERERA